MCAPQINKLHLHHLRHLANLEQYMTNSQEQLAWTQKIVAEGRMKYLESIENQYD